MTRSTQLKLIDLPRVSERKLYERTIDKVVTALSRDSSVNSIYQVGGIKHPGISDIDLLVVVHDAAESRSSPLATLSDDERYLFSHSCFLIPESLAAELNTYSLFHGYRHLYGSSWKWQEDLENATSAPALHQQTAMEFLAKNLLDLYVQAEYRIVKVRALLQHVKGLQLDLALLQITDDPLNQLVDKARVVIDDWFQIRSIQQRITELVSELLPLLHHTVDEITRHTPLYAPTRLPLFIAPNMVVDTGRGVTLRRRGFRLPKIGGMDERRHFNAHHRVNRFELELPAQPATIGSYHAERFAFFRMAKAFASTRFPAFAAPIPPLFYYAVSSGDHV